jgi:hypothetical protein
VRLVIVESPYAGNVERNLQYLRAALRDCLLRGESPYASHGLLTQPGVLRDEVPGERATGISAGFRIAEALHRCGAPRVFYVDLGWSGGMELGREHAERIGQALEFRKLPEWVHAGCLGGG